jgi:L-arabinose isomerase
MSKNLIETKPKIGFMTIGLNAYWAQFEGIRDNIISYHDKLVKKFGDGCDLIDSGLVDTVQTSIEAGQLFRSNDVDIVFCYTATYSPSANLLPAIKDLDVPVVFLNIQCVKSLDIDAVSTIGEWLGSGFTCGCVPEMVSVCKRTGKRYYVITGYLENDSVVDQEIKQWCLAAGVRTRLRNTGIALLGRPYPGMMDLYIDETNLFKKIGCYTHYIEWDDIKNELTRVSAADANKMADMVLKTFFIEGGSSEKKLGDLPAIICALERIAVKYNVTAIASHYAGDPKGEDAVIFSALNPAFSILINEGISSAVEGDIKAALAMTILRTIGGSATLAELYSMDFNNDICFIGHSGSGDPAVSVSRKPLMKISEVFHGKTTGGYLTQFYPEFGDVTILTLTQDETGDYRMVAVKGKCLDGPIFKLGDTNSRVAFSCGLREFVNKWSNFGPTHHGVLGLGGHIDTLKKVSIVLGIPLDIVCE